MKKLKNGNGDGVKLSELAVEAQRRILEAAGKMDYRGLAAWMGKAPPDGMGISVSYSTVRRFVLEAEARALEEAREESAEQARRFRKQEDSDFAEGTLSLLKQRMFEGAVESKSDAGQRELYRILLAHEVRMKLHEARLERLKLAREQLEFSRERFEFNASREALRALPELLEIAEAQGKDDEEKVWLARGVLFRKKRQGVEKRNGANGSEGEPPKAKGGTTYDGGGGLGNERELAKRELGGPRDGASKEGEVGL